MAITWNELAKQIAEMPPEQRKKLVQSRDMNTGELYTYSGVDDVFDDDVDDVFDDDVDYLLDTDL